MDAKMEELQKLCEPVAIYLKRFNPHTSIIITAVSVKVDETQIFIPVNGKNDYSDKS